MNKVPLLCDGCWFYGENTCHNEKIVSPKRSGLDKQGEYISLGLLERCNRKSCYRNKIQHVRELIPDEEEVLV